MRLHVVGLPFEPQPQCAYSGKHARFVTMMRARGHDVFEYAARPDEWDPDRSFDVTSSYWAAFNARVIDELRGNAEPRDAVCLIGGLCQQPIAHALEHMLVVEYGVGYAGVCPTTLHVFESYAWMHAVYGAQAGTVEVMRTPGRMFDAVIPNYYDPADFPAGPGGDGYAFVGRVTGRKGPSVAADACEHLGVPLTLAGVGDWDGYGTHVGVLDQPATAALMGSVAAMFVPTLYLEPFGGVAAEARLCGTPVLTTDFGAFPEYVEQCVDGFRCRTLAEFTQAAVDAKSLDRDVVRERAQARFSLDVVGAQFDAFFERAATLWGDGWYQ